MTATTHLRARCAHRWRADRQWRRRWDMAWTAPPCGWLVGQGMVAAALAGATAGGLTVLAPTVAALNPVAVFFATPFGAAVGGILGFLGSLVVAPVVALVLRRTHARSIRIALRRARLAAVAATFLLFQVQLPVAVAGRPAGFHELWTIFVAIACVAAWCAARAFVVEAVRLVHREPQT